MKVSQEKIFKYLAISVLFVSGIFNFTSLNSGFPVHVDESWYGEGMWSYASRGNFSEPMFEGIYGLEKANVVWGRIYLVIHGLFLRYLGLGVWQLRLPESIFMFLSAYLLFITVREISGKLVGYIATVIFLSSPHFYVQAHMARPEGMLLFFFLLSIYLFITGFKKKNFFIMFFSGLAAGLSTEVHMNGFLFSIILVLFALIYMKNTEIHFRLKYLGCIFAGIFIGFSVWVFWHILVDPALFFSQWNNVWKENSLVPNEYIKPAVYYDYLKDVIYRFYMQFASLWHVGRSLKLYTFIVFSFLIFMLISGIREKNKINVFYDPSFKLLVIIWIVLSLLSSNPYAYSIFFFVCLVMLIGNLFLNATNRNLSLQNLLSISALFLLVLSGLVIDIHHMRQNTENNYLRYAKKLKSNVNQGGIIYGNPHYWLAFAESRVEYYATFSADLLKKDPTVREAVLKRMPDYLICGAEQDKEFIESLPIKRIVLIKRIYDPRYGYWSRKPGDIPYVDIYKVYK